MDQTVRRIALVMDGFRVILRDLIAFALLDFEEIVAIKNVKVEHLANLAYKIVLFACTLIKPATTSMVHAFVFQVIKDTFANKYAQMIVMATIVKMNVIVHRSEVNVIMKTVIAYVIQAGKESSALKLVKTELMD